MVSATLIRSEDDVRDFYMWLVHRAQEEEEENGNDEYARIYRELALGIKKFYDGHVSSIASN